MALRNTVAVSLIIMMIFCGACSATVYTVGGDLEGWTDTDYDYCIPSLPLSHYGTFTALTFDKPGTYYVICGEPGHCKAGQKIKIKINALEIEDPVVSPSPSPSPSSASGSPSNAKAMSPSSKITRPLPVLNLVMVGAAATALLMLVAWVSHFIYRRLNESMFQAEKSSQVV
ncbi:blue copper protein-like [Pyrus ussuriensis x Pyrus communis]|uniref:Blue copper protein-like n=1 Tax=Pyrus ussuriensis x Pyrus communis TaxID=2448454 RepID=A0A5N5FYC2_9ROSA|nr:blue copper protein-like [Pyrus ussuriensis x Pyrus communis]